MYGKETDDPETTIAPSKGILQKYLTNPLLITQEKVKFDIRCYLLIAKNEPHTVAYYHPGYCRLALKTFDLTNIGDLGIHLTNAAVQKKDPSYQEKKENQIVSMDDVAKFFEENGQQTSADFIRQELDRQIKLCMVDVLKASSNKLLRKHGYFDLLGFDFMLDDANKVYLIEVNTNPAMSKDNAVLDDLLPRVIDGAIDKVLSHQGPKNCNKIISLPAQTSVESINNGEDKEKRYKHNYELIFDEESNFCYV